MYDAKNYRLKITTGLYRSAPPEDREMLKGLFGEEAEYDYEIYFHWYNVIHELGHAILRFNLPELPHPADEEQLVNNFAVAYWRHYGEKEKLENLQSIVCETLQRFSAPTQDKSYIQFAKENWDTDELSSFNNYGWFQFSCVNAAILNPLSLDEVLREMCACEVIPQRPEITQYDICEEMPIRIISDAMNIMKTWGMQLPENFEVIFCDDVNTHNCQLLDL